MKNIFIITLSIIIFCLIGQIIVMDKQIKTQSRIIEIDNQFIEKHERELELYGDFIVAILDGENRERILLKENVLKAGAKMTEMRKKIELLNKLKHLNK